METLGLIDPNRLIGIPRRYRPQHEFCFHIHDSMLSILLEVVGKNYPSIEIKFDSEEKIRQFEAAGDPISYFLESGQHKIARDLSVGQALMAILSDFFNFVYEGLIALEKRKFVVAFALFRKPLKENLLFLTMILVDDQKFFNGLRNSPASSFGHPGIQNTHRKEYFAKAKKIIPYSDFVDPEILHDLIFDIGLETGFAPLFDKANHLVTNREKIKTEDMNLNFIFKDPNDNDVYECVYKYLSYILLYALLLEIELFKKAGLDSGRLSQWFSLTGLGSYGALFLNGRCSVRGAMNRLLKEFLFCPHCGDPLKITKRNAARFFTVHKLTCKACGHEHDFPLFWLLSKVDWSISDVVDSDGLD